LSWWYWSVSADI